MTRLQVTVESKGAVLAIEGFGRRAARAEAALEDIGDELRRVHAAAFASGGRGLAAPWAPVKASTARRKAREGWDQRIMVRRGDLRDSLTSRSHPFAVQRVRGGQVEFGTRSPVARLLASAGKGRPARRAVQLPASTDRIIEILRRHLDGGGR